MDPKLAAHYEVGAVPPSLPQPTEAAKGAGTAGGGAGVAGVEPLPLHQFERRVYEWRNLMLEFKAAQDQMTQVRKRRKSCEADLLQLMETLERDVHQVSSDQTLVVARTTTHQAISDKYLAQQLPKIVEDPELAQSIHRFLLAQRATKAGKRLKVARRPPPPPSRATSDASTPRDGDSRRM
jgi:hypothetical protein